MSKSANVAVVGAGIVGICCAYFLKKSGLNVTLIDKNEPGSMTSYGHACTFADYASIPVNSSKLFYQIPSMLAKSDGPLSVDLFYVLKNLNWSFQFLKNCTPKQVNYISSSLGSILSHSTLAYDEIFKEVDVSGDGQVDFDEFRNLINKTLKLNLSNQRMKDLFAASDKNGEGQLNAREFEGAMKKLEAVIVDVGLRKLGLTEHSLIPLGIFLVLYMVLLITFILTGFAAFTPGTAFGAGVGSLLPLIAGKTAGIGNLIENVDFKEYKEKVLKEDFQN